jgi:predicted dehydrogenase
MRRRSFLKTLAASSASLALPNILRAQSVPAPSNRLTLGVIGCGGMGSGHIGGLLGEDRVQIVAVCDVFRENAEKAKGRIEEAYAQRSASGTYNGCSVTQDFREVIARPDIDAVLIAVPDHWHAIPLIAAAQAGKHIYAEKPLSLTIPEGQAMVRAVEQSGVVCQIGSQQRSGQEFQRAFEIVRNGLLGKMRRVRVGLPGGGGPQINAPMAAETVPEGMDFDMWLGPAPWAPYYHVRCFYEWRWIFDYSGGQVTDWIGHHYDCAAWMLGLNKTGPVAIEDASAVFSTSPLFNTAVQYSFHAKYADGTVIEVSSDHPGGITFEGTDGTMHVDRGRLEVNPEALRTEPISTSSGVTLERGSHWKNFLDAVAFGGSTICPISEAHRTVSVAHLANLAFRTGRSRIEWDPAAQKLINAPDAERLFSRTYRAPWQLPC